MINNNNNNNNNNINNNNNNNLYLKLWSVKILTLVDFGFMTLCSRAHKLPHELQCTLMLDYKLWHYKH